MSCVFVARCLLRVVRQLSPGDGFESFVDCCLLSIVGFMLFVCECVSCVVLLIVCCSSCVVGCVFMCVVCGLLFVVLCLCMMMFVVCSVGVTRAAFVVCCVLCGKYCFLLDAC